MLLPVKDAERFLPDCLTSLARQTLADHEIVAVDDGSLDESRECLLAAKDPRIRIFRNVGCGLVAALNTALREARGDLLARMDADDVAHPERLALQEGRLGEDASTDILGCRVRLIGHGGPGGSAGMRSYLEWSNSLVDHVEIARDMLVESPIVHPSAMMRRRLLLELGGYRDYEGPEDYDLWLRAHAAGARFAKVPETLLDWRDRPDRLTRTDARYSPDRFRDRKVAALLRGPLSGDRPVVVWGAGPIGKGWARALLSRGRRIAAFVDVDPRKLGQTIHGAQVVEAEEAVDVVGALHLAAVGQLEARRRIREIAQALGLLEGRDLLAVA